MVAMKTFAFTVVLTIVTACAGGSAGRPSTPASEASGTTASSVVASLRDAGLEIRDAGTVEQPFFGVPARVFVVEGRDLQLYEFASATHAEQAASQVAPGGSPIGTSMVTWMAPPHFFRKDRVIANYVGTSERVLTELRRVFGPQFAGR
jgi:hypothetical protein